MTTWLPACDPAAPPGWPSSNVTKGVCGARSDLADYANKQWGGLVGGYYADRMACYAQSRDVRQPEASFQLNVTAYNVCIDRVSWSFQNGGAGNDAAWPWKSGTDQIALSKALIAKWRDLPVDYHTHDA